MPAQRLAYARDKEGCALDVPDGARPRLAPRRTATRGLAAAQTVPDEADDRRELELALDRS